MVWLGVSTVQLAIDRLVAKDRKGVGSCTVNSPKSFSIEYDGQDGNYHGVVSSDLQGDVSCDLQAINQLLVDRGCIYLGRLHCSQFSQIVIDAYATLEHHVAISVMTDESGLVGIDCVSKFIDESFLTTTTTQVIQNAYDEQRLFRVSFPQLDALALLEQHLSLVPDFEKKYGEAQTTLTDLLTIAHLIDEYSTRQKSNIGHGFFKFAGAFAQARVSEMMGDVDEDSEYDDDEYDDDEYKELIEYDEEEVSPLIRAILHDDLAEVKALIEAGTNLEPSGWDEQVPLVAAVYHGNPDIIQMLMTAGVDLDRLDCSVNARPLGMAIKKNRSDLVRFLLDGGASPEGGDIEDTALAVAINQNNLPILQLLMEGGANPDAGMEDDYRAIMLAALLGRLEMVQLLVTHGADVSAWSQGETAIMSAAQNAHQTVYDYLYPLVDVGTRRYADKHGQKEIANAIKRKAREKNKLAMKLGDAALFGKLSKVQQLIAIGADPNSMTKTGKSALMCAAMYGHTAVISALLTAGADPNLQGDEEFDEGQTALMYIASSFFAQNRSEVIQLLVENGADVNIQDDKGKTALHHAGRNSDAVRALIEAGSDIDILDNDGNTALMLGSFAIQQLLRQAGASEIGINDVALVEAVRQEDVAKVDELLQAGANINYQDGAALVAAASQGNIEIIDRLIQSGADVNLGWRTGFTPIANAAYKGYLNVVERLLTLGADPFQRTHDEGFYDALDYAQKGQAEGHYKGTDHDHAAVIELLSQLQPD